jgi:hypothetical protein
VRKVFISYARQNKPDIEQLVEHLRVLGCDTWHDSSLRGGQDWWEEILGRIADCDTFIAIISRDALSSTACRREFDWAESLNKPVLPVAVEPPPKALPRRFSRRQIIDYSERESRDGAALTLGGGLATLPSAPPLPDPPPEPPAAPLSYLTDLIDLVTEQAALDHAQQRDILNQLEPALRSVDPEERRGASDILEMLSSRDDLYADVDRSITRLKGLRDQGVAVSGQHASRPAVSDAQAPQPFDLGAAPSPEVTAATAASNQTSTAGAPIEQNEEHADEPPLLKKLQNAQPTAENAAFVGSQAPHIRIPPETVPVPASASTDTPPTWEQGPSSPPVRRPMPKLPVREKRSRLLVALVAALGTAMFIYGGVFGLLWTTHVDAGAGFVYCGRPIDRDLSSAILADNTHYSGVLPLAYESQCRYLLNRRLMWSIPLTVGGALVGGVSSVILIRARPRAAGRSGLR